MGKKIKLFSKRFITRLFQILGISSLLTAFGCGDHFGAVMYGPEPVDMYGTPTNYYILEGNIVDEENKPIEGIKVSVQANETDTYDKNELSFSEENGSFYLKWSRFPSDNMDFTINLEDIDGEENGSFNNRTLNVEYKNDDMIEKKSWTKKYTKELGSIQLQKKNNLDSSEQQE